METVSCPFDLSMCASPAIAFDSGLLDLNSVFGMNLPPKDRVRYRRRTTCTILALEGRTRVVNLSPQNSTRSRTIYPGEQFLQYLFSVDEGESQSFTFGFSLAIANLTASFGTT